MKNLDKKEIKQEIKRMNKEIAEHKKANAERPEHIRQLQLRYKAQLDDIKSTKDQIQELAKRYNFRGMPGQSTKNLTADSVKDLIDSVNTTREVNKEKISELNGQIQTLKRDIATFGKDSVSHESKINSKGTKPKTRGEELREIEKHVKLLKSNDGGLILLKIEVLKLEKQYEQCDFLLAQRDYVLKDVKAREKAIVHCEKRIAEMQGLLQKMDQPAPPKNTPKPG